MSDGVNDGSGNDIKAVVDTQLFLRAAINPQSLPAKLIFELKTHYQLIISDDIVAEVREVLYRPKIRAKFPHLTDTIAETILALLANAENVHVEEVLPISRDPKDDIFLACAKASGAHFIVTEDQDLLVLHPYENVSIINALDFLKILQAP